MLCGSEGEVMIIKQLYLITVVCIVTVGSSIGRNRPDYLRAGDTVDTYSYLSKNGHTYSALLPKNRDPAVNGDKMYMGDAHWGGRAFAKKHIVIPGNKQYLQSFEQFR
jgi:hypothetical protein